MCRRRESQLPGARSTTITRAPSPPHQQPTSSPSPQTRQTHPQEQLSNTRRRLTAIFTGRHRLGTEVYTTSHHHSPSGSRTSSTYSLMEAPSSRGPQQAPTGHLERMVGKFSEGLLEAFVKHFSKPFQTPSIRPSGKDFPKPFLTERRALKRGST